MTETPERVRRLIAEMQAECEACADEAHADDDGRVER